MGDVNAIWAQVILPADNLLPEIHYSEECKFIVKKLPWIILGAKTRLFVLIRHCICGQRPNRSNLASTKVLYLSDFDDGVELHLTDECYYKIQHKLDGSVYLKRLCYCPR